MATETDTSPSGWTVETLKQFLTTALNDMSATPLTIRTSDDLRYQQRFDASEKALQAALASAKEAVNAALAASDRAVSKAEMAAEKRFEAVNEFRGTLQDQAARMLTRTEADARFEALTEKVSTIPATISKLELELRGSTAIAVNRQDLKPILDSIDKIRDTQSVSGGRSSGFTTIFTGMIAVIAILVSLGGIFYANHAPDAKRMDDLVTRFDALSNRMNQSQH